MKPKNERVTRDQLIALLEINNKLSRIESFDELCKEAVRLAKEKLGFDRIGIWFKSKEPNKIEGSFGIDEKGNVRDERNSVLPLDNEEIARKVRSLKPPKVLVRNTYLRDNKGKVVGKGMWACAVLWCGNKNIGYVMTDNFFSGKEINTELLALFAATFGHLCELVRTKDILKKSEEKYRELWDNAPIAYHILNPEGIIIAVNKTEAEMLGYEVEEMVGRSIFDFIHPKQREEARKRFLLKIKGCKLPKANGRVYLRKDGSPVIVSIEDKVERDMLGRVISIRTTMVDITEKKKEEKLIRKLAYTDGLTGLPNRMYFRGYLASHIQWAKYNEQKFALLFLDIDNFKHINDNNGHIAGDKVLKIISKRITDVLRKNEVVARIGGDEFLILVSDVSTVDSVNKVIKKILKSIQAPIVMKRETINVTASIGVSFFPQDGKDVDTLWKKSDIAMYEAKRAGRNTWRFYRYLK
ncbi:MAG: diguanylate cyclase [bacterium]|nr:diguanylate cyclase [bacterium]